MDQFSENEIAEIDGEPVLEDCPEGYVVPTMERDRKGRLLPGHPGLKKARPQRISEAQALKLHKQEMTFLTHNEEVALKREAIHAVIGEYEIKQAILDIYNSAKAAENPYTKKALYELFFQQ